MKIDEDNWLSLTIELLQEYIFELEEKHTIDREKVNDIEKLINYLNK